MTDVVVIINDGEEVYVYKNSDGLQDSMEKAIEEYTNRGKTIHSYGNKIMVFGITKTFG